MSGVAAWEDDYGDAYVAGTLDPTEAEVAWEAYRNDVFPPVMDDERIYAVDWARADRFWIEPTVYASNDGEGDPYPDEAVSETERPGWVPHLWIHS